MDTLATTPPQADLLLACLQADKTIDQARLARMSLPEWQTLVALARSLGVSSLLYHRLKIEAAQKVVPDEIWQQLARQFKSTTLRNMRLLSELHQIIKALDDVKIPVIVLKGAYLVPIVYPHVGLRPMSDLDLLIPIADVLQATAIVKAQGYQLPREIDDLDLQFLHACHLPQMVKEGSYYVEIHGRLTKLNETYACDPQTWWQGTQTVEITGLPVKVLAPIELILHLCIHISYQHRFSIDLRHYYDLVQLLQYLDTNLDWEELLKRAYLRGWGKGTLMVLKITQRLFGLVLPEKTVNTLDSEKNDEELICLAIDEMWASPTLKISFLSKDVAEYQYRPGILAKIDYIRQRIFIPRGLMAQKYPVPANSLRIYPYYLVRMKDLLCKHSRTLQQMSQGETETITTATRKYKLWQWLNNGLA